MVMIITILILTLFFSILNWYSRKKFIKSREGMFEIEVVPSWFSKDYVSFRYTNNGGITWNNVKEACKPYLDHIDYDWTWEDVTYRLNVYEPDFSHELEKWGSIEKIEAWHKSEREIYEMGNKKVRERREEVRRNREEAYKKANKK